MKRLILIITAMAALVGLAVPAFETVTDTAPAASAQVTACTTMYTVNYPGYARGRCLATNTSAPLNKKFQVVGVCHKQGNVFDTISYGSPYYLAKTGAPYASITCPTSRPYLLYAVYVFAP